MALRTTHQANLSTISLRINWIDEQIAHLHCQHEILSSKRDNESRNVTIFQAQYDVFRQRYCMKSSSVVSQRHLQLHQWICCTRIKHPCYFVRYVAGGVEQFWVFPVSEGIGPSSKLRSQARWKVLNCSPFPLAHLGDMVCMCRKVPPFSDSWTKSCLWGGVIWINHGTGRCIQPAPNFMPPAPLSQHFLPNWCIFLVFESLVWSGYWPPSGSNWDWDGY